MSYQLGIDLGTTYTAAAICRGTERAPAGADVVTLGTRSATVASVLYLADDGSILVGDAAERRAITDPDRVVREFKRRIGDEIPLMIAGRPHQAHELAARMIRWVVDHVSEREGGAPRRISVTHPASWGQHKKDLLGAALRTVGLTVTFLAEPQAAAVSYASAERVEPGSTIAVYDLGGGTFDAAVVRKSGSGAGFELLGQPEGIERLGGVDFDEVVFGHVRESLGSALDDVNPDDKDVLSAVARLRRECVEAKEALSSDTEATIPVLLPELRTQSRLVRAEFETMIRPALEETVEALRRAVFSAGLTPDDLSAVLLVGGSSRIPLVSQLVSDGLGRPVAVDADPKMAIALGAALAISPQQPRRAGPGMAAAPGVAAASGVAAAPHARPGERPGVGPDSAPAAAAGAPGAAVARATPPRSPARSAPPAPPRSRPPAAFADAPARPPVDYQRPNYPGAAGYGGDGYAGTERRRQTGLLIGVGGVIAIAVIVAALFLWPKASGANAPGTTSDLTPEETTPATTAPAAPDTGSKQLPRTTPPRTTPKAPVTPPKVTSSTPPSTSSTPSSTSSTPSSTSSTPSSTSSTTGGPTTSPGTSDTSGTTGTTTAASPSGSSTNTSNDTGDSAGSSSKSNSASGASPGSSNGLGGPRNARQNDGASPLNQPASGDPASPSANSLAAPTAGTSNAL